MSLHETVVAHRGGAGLAPENTMAAFERSYALGVRLLETDVQTTRDGVALAFHDARLTRCAGIRRRVAELTWPQLRSTRIDGEPILRLDDALMAFPDASFLIDVKARRNVTPLVSALRRTRAAGRVCVADGRDSWLHDITDLTGAYHALGWRELMHLLACAKLGVGPPADLGTGAFAAHAATRLAGLSWMEDPRVAARLVDISRAAGLRLVTWTVDDPTHMARYLDAGADAVITDRPDLLRDVLIARGQWTPPSNLPTNRPLPTSQRARPQASLTRTDRAPAAPLGPPPSLAPTGKERSST